MIFGAEARLSPKLRFEVRRHPRIPHTPHQPVRGVLLNVAPVPVRGTLPLKEAAVPLPLTRVNVPRMQGAPAIEGVQPLTGTGRAGH